MSSIKKILFYNILFFLIIHFAYGLLKLFIYLLIYFYCIGLGYKINWLTGKISSQPCTETLGYDNMSTSSLFISYVLSFFFIIIIYFIFFSGFRCSHLCGLGFPALKVELLGKSKCSHSAGIDVSSLQSLPEPNSNSTDHSDCVKYLGRSIPVWQQGYITLAMQLFDV